MTAGIPPSDRDAAPLPADLLPEWAPLREAIRAAAAANALGFWDHGCRLWRDLFRRNAIAGLAAHGAAEAALHAGRFALADHMLAHVLVRSSGLRALVADAEQIRTARKDARQSRDSSLSNIVLEQQIKIRLYDDTLAMIVRMNCPDRLLPIALQALHGLGRHDLVDRLTDDDEAGLSVPLIAFSRDRLEQRRANAAGAADDWFDTHRFLLDGTID